jgi:hypothetical protein
MVAAAVGRKGLQEVERYSIAGGEASRVGQARRVEAAEGVGRYSDLLVKHHLLPAMLSLSSVDPVPDPAARSWKGIWRYWAELTTLASKTSSLRTIGKAWVYYQR